MRNSNRNIISYVEIQQILKIQYFSAACEASYLPTHALANGNASLHILACLMKLQVRHVKTWRSFEITSRARITQRYSALRGKRNEVLQFMYRQPGEFNLRKLANREIRLTNPQTLALETLKRRFLLKKNKREKKYNRSSVLLPCMIGSELAIQTASPRVNN